MPKALVLAYKSAPVALAYKAAAPQLAAAPVVAAPTAEGVVTAIVAVTGVEDTVADVITPGAFAKSLTVRRPKVVWSHDTNDPIGRVLHIEEWLPGDRRLPTQTKDLKPWPREAGALVATMQLNLASTRGREAYEAVRFFTESAECEWSIGYVATKAVRNTKGVRHIAEMDLWECSPVLFGAAPLSMTLSLKSALGHTPSEDETVAEMHRLAAADVAAEVAAAAAVEVPTTPEGVREVIAGFTRLPPPERKAARWAAVEGALRLDRPDLVPARWVAEVKAGGADRNRGNAENLRRWYVAGGGAAKIRWGTDGDFMRCVKIAGKHMTPDNAKGYCNLRHQEAVGGNPPGKGHKSVTYAYPEGLDGKRALTAQQREAAPTLPGGGNRFPIATQEDVAAAVRAYGRASEEDKPRVKRWIMRRARELGCEHLIPDSWGGSKGYDPTLEVGPYAGTVEVKGLAGPRFEGALEEHLERVRCAVTDLLRGLPVESGGPAPGALAPSGGGFEWDHVMVNATWPDRVIATRERWPGGASGSSGAAESFEVPYTVTGDGSVAVGEPREVRLAVDVEYDGDGDDGDPGVAPLAGLLGEAAWAGKALSQALEVKAGRVLSAANEERLRAAVEHLIAVLAAAGVRIGERARDGSEPYAGNLPDTTAPAALAESKGLEWALRDPAGYAESLIAE